METVQTVLLVIQVLVAISLIGLILIQHGKGADAGAAFGSGASHTVFGAQGSGNFLSRTTAILAFIFLTNSLGLAYIASQRVQSSRSLMDQPVTVVQSATSPATDAVNDIPVEPLSPAVNEIPAAPVANVSEVPAEPTIDVPVIDAAALQAAPAEPPSVEVNVPAEPAVKVPE